MQVLVHNDAVARNFSAAASSYERWADPQRRTARRLMNMLPPTGRVNTILDVGCGTGFLVEMLHDRLLVRGGHLKPEPVVAPGFGDEAFHLVVLELAPLVRGIDPEAFESGVVHHLGVAPVQRTPDQGNALRHAVVSGNRTWGTISVAS